MKKILIALCALTLLGAGLWYLFGRGPATGPVTAIAPGTPLDFAPADSPFVFANLEPLPQPTIDALLQQGEAALTLWRAQFDLIDAKLAEEPDAQPARRWLRALEAELRGRELTESLTAIGLDTRAHSAVYGIGLVPVARVALLDPAALRAFVARLEAHAGERIATGSIDGIDYWQFTSPDAPLRMVLALHANHAVFTVAPAGDDGPLRRLLGIEPPEKSMREDTALADLNQRYGFTPYASGFVDTARVLALLASEVDAFERSMLAALDLEKPALDAICRAEFEALAAAAPRLVIGYPTLDARLSHSVTRLELRESLAQELMQLRAPLPGLDAAQDAAFNFGFALQLSKLPVLARTWSGAVAKAPWKCESLAPLNDAFADLGQQAANPAVFATAPVLQSVHAVVSRIEFSAGTVIPEFAGKLLLGSPNPGALFGMARSFAPGLAQFELAPDGATRALPELPGFPAGMAVHARMTEDMLGLAIGVGEETSLAEAMRFDAANQPLFVLGYSGAALSKMMQQMHDFGATLQDPKERADAEQAMLMMREMYGMIGRLEMRLEFDRHGVALHQHARLR